MSSSPTVTTAEPSSLSVDEARDRSGLLRFLVVKDETSVAEGPSMIAWDFNIPNSVARRLNDLKSIWTELKPLRDEADRLEECAASEPFTEAERAELPSYINGFHSVECGQTPLSEAELAEKVKFYLDLEEEGKYTELAKEARLVLAKRCSELEAWKVEESEEIVRASLSDCWTRMARAHRNSVLWGDNDLRDTVLSCSSGGWGERSGEYKLHSWLAVENGGFEDEHRGSRVGRSAHGIGRMHPGLGPTPEGVLYEVVRDFHQS